MTSFAHGYPRILNGNSRIRNVSTITPYTVARVFCMHISPDGRFFALGDEDGTLEILVLRRGTWRCACLYSTGGAVHTLVWHPTEGRTIFSGSSNGAIHKITVVVGGNNDLYDALVPGYIHFLVLSPNGQRLVIAHGRSISVVENPFQQHNHLGTLINIDIMIGFNDNSGSLIDCYIPRAMFFLPNDNTTILVAFLGTRGLRAYSLLNQGSINSIPLRDRSLIGSAAISPSRERIAVMNLQDGIDFYSTSHRRYLSTTRYNLSSQVPLQNFIVDILFVDDDTVAFGHSDGYVGFATFGIDRVSTVFEMATSRELVPVQVLTFGLVENIPLIFALASPSPATSLVRHSPNISIGRIDTPGMPQYPQNHGQGATTNFDFSREVLHSKLPIAMITILVTIGVTIVSIAVGGTPNHGPGLPTGSTPPSSTSTAIPCSTIANQTYHVSTITSAFDPSSTCICTVTGIIDAASKESGIF